MEYERSIEIKGEPKQALDAVLSILVQHGFAIARQYENRVDFKDPGMVRFNAPAAVGRTRGPLRGASDVSVEARDGMLSLRADFSGVRRMRKLMVYLVLGLAFFFVVVFGLLFRERPSVTLMALIPLTPWVVLIPLMDYFFKRAAIHALDTLLDNAAALAQCT
ncbi:MAG TPA: hypothetical protein ENN80_12495 [Candidatus Hydrogenedentes bacterium]|nr:hypothetical protein [Candidatus Hydrogenedentota bacterium]